MEYDDLHGLKARTFGYGFFKSIKMMDNIKLDVLRQMKYGLLITVKISINNYGYFDRTNDRNFCCFFLLVCYIFHQNFLKFLSSVLLKYP